jgi:hypothetical protein
MSDREFDCATATESSSHDDDQLPFALTEERPAKIEEYYNAAVPSRAADAGAASGFGKEVVHDSSQQHGLMLSTTHSTPSKKPSSSCSGMLFLNHGQGASQLSACSSSSSSSRGPPQMVTSSILSSPSTTVDSSTSCHHLCQSSSSSHIFGNTTSSSILLPLSSSSPSVVVEDDESCCFSSHYLDAAASLLLPHNNGGSILARASFSTTTSSAAQVDADNTNISSSSSSSGLMHARSHDVSFSQLLLHQQAAASWSSSPSSSNPNVTDKAARPFSGGASTISMAHHLPPLLEEASYIEAVTTSSCSRDVLSSSSYFTLPDAHSSSYHHESATSLQQHEQQRQQHQNDAQEEQLQQTIVPEASDASILREHKRHQYRLRQHRNTFCGVAATGGGPCRGRALASLAGATARMTGDLSFDVSIDLVVPNCTVADVVDIVGNPDMLHLWCDAVSSLVITSMSEGAQDAGANRRRRINVRSDTTMTPVVEPVGNDARHPRQEQELHREYHGEWIEATTAQLILPVNNSLSCIYSTSRMLLTAMGFPTYGKITMFVERHRGHVGLTMGPLPGGYEVLHCIQVETISGVDRRIRMTDHVRLQTIDFDSARTGASHSEANVNFCGLFSVFERCFLPTPEDYMDQVLNSMARLRFLVENGEQETDRTMSHFHRLHGEPLIQENGDNAMTAPLLVTA